MAEMKSIVRGMTKKGSGVLDASENPQELGKLLTQAGIDNTPEIRSAWRELLCTTPELGKYCSCVILDEEGVEQETSDGRSLPRILWEEGVETGVTVDAGLFPLNGYGEKGTDGLADLEERVPQYYQRGVRLAKWRIQVLCTMELPTDICIWEVTSRLGEAGRVCQAVGLVFAPEIEVVMGPGNHSVERGAYILEKVHSQAIRMLNEFDANLEATVLLTSVVGAGRDAGPVLQDDMARLTMRSLGRTVPPALGGLQILPGQGGPEAAARDLRALQIAAVDLPWMPLPVYKAAHLLPSLAPWGSEQELAEAKGKLATFLEALSTSQLGVSDDDQQQGS